MAEPAPTTVFIVLGSNIEPRANLERARARLARRLNVRAVSGIWESEPYGAPGTPPFLNAAVRIVTRLSLASLKRLLRRIEADLGRRRSGDRNPEIDKRAYLALPLAEIGPEVVHPETGESLAAIAARLAGEPEPPRRIASRLGSGTVADL